MFAAVVGQSWAVAAHPFNLEVNGVDLIGYARMESVRIEMPGPGSNGSMTFELEDPTASLTIAAWDEVRFLEHAATRPILFGGFVQSVRYVAWAVTGRTVEVQCVGYGVLLDRRIAPTFAPAYGNSVAHDIVSAVGLIGGRLSALMPSSPGYTDATFSVPYNTNWNQDPVTYGDGSSLRSIIDAAIGNGYYSPIALSTMDGVFWADSAARVCAFPDWPDGVSAGDAVYAYDGGAVPGLTVDTSGTLRLTKLTYEEEDTDRLTAVYVADSASTDAAWYTTPTPGRAGDLQAYVGSSVYAFEVAAGQVINPTLGLAVRGTVGIEASAPIDVWPGRNLQLTAAQLGQNAADFRITGVRIEFLGGAHREYSIDYGGSASAPSFARRSGRFAPGV